MPRNAHAVNVEYSLGAETGKTYPAVCPGGSEDKRASLDAKDESFMYIVAIGWLYVALMMAITEKNVVAGVATFLFYGAGPVALVLYIMGTPGRRRRRKAQEAREDEERRQQEKAARQRGPE